ncbi:MAG: hypothetical protein FJ292_08565 [Planctomycetes bacterium]|nr:hypothetical protein [Planctomycetota bacterium]
MATADPVAEYLSQLQRALIGVDAAVAHDALVDAEAHLRAAIKAGKSPAAAIEAFGPAADFARAYAGAPAPDHHAATEVAGSTHPAASVASGPDASSGALAALSRIPLVGVWFHPRAWSSLFYFLAPCFLISLATFVWVVCVGSLALGTLPILIGLPLAVFLLGSVRVIALAEGKVVEFLLGVRMPHRVQPVQVLTPIGGVAEVGFWQRIGCWLTDVRSWLSLAWALGNFFVATGLFCIFVVLGALVLVMVAVPLAQAAGMTDIRVDGEWRDVQFLWERVTPDADGHVRISAVTSVLSIVLGMALATATLWLALGAGWVYAQVVKAIQVTRPQAVARRFTVIS